MPEKCSKCNKWHYTQKEMENGAPGGIAPEPGDDSEKSDEQLPPFDEGKHKKIRIKKYKH